MNEDPKRLLDRIEITEENAQALKRIPWILGIFLIYCAVFLVVVMKWSYLCSFAKNLLP